MEYRLGRVVLFRQDIATVMEGEVEKLLSELPETALACIGVAISEAFYGRNIQLPCMKLNIRLVGYGEDEDLD